MTVGESGQRAHPVGGGTQRPGGAQGKLDLSRMEAFAAQVAFWAGKRNEKNNDTSGPEPELEMAVEKVIEFLHAINDHAWELLRKAEDIHAKRTLHSGSGNDSQANAAGTGRQ